MTAFAIVIVNWNSGELLRECVASISESTVPVGFDLAGIVVVDNGSADGSSERIDANGAPLRVIVNTENRGFAAACNQGAAAAGDAELLLFLNPDTRLLRESLVTPLSFLQSPANDRVGIVGIQLVGDDGAVARSCARFPTPLHFVLQCVGADRVAPRLGHTMREWDHAETRRVDQVIGAFFLVRTPLFRQLNGFDERFFVYFEEVDFALRAWRAGWSSFFVADAKAYHLGGGTSDQIKGTRLFYSLRSRLLFGMKHFGWFGRAVLQVVTWVFEPLSRAAHLAISGRSGELVHLAKAYRLLLHDRLHQA